MVIRKPPIHHAPNRPLASAVAHRRQIGRPPANQSAGRKGLCGAHTRSHARRGQTGHGHRMPRVVPPPTYYSSCEIFSLFHRRIDVGRQKFQVPGRRVARCYRLSARRQPIEVPSHGGGKVGRKTTTRLAAPHIAPTLLSRSMPSKSLADLLFFQHQPGSDLRPRCFCLLTYALMNESVR